MSGDDFMCESAVFNGTHCKTQCKSCAPRASTITIAEMKRAFDKFDQPATIDQRVVLPKWLYDAAKKEGVDMKFYIRNELLPTSPRTKR
jgi:hypothetical protein